MRYYETLFLINPDLSHEDYGEVVSKFTSLVEKNNGVVTKVEEWDKKPLAYKVRKYDKGYYVLLQYCGEPGITEELRRDFRLDDRVLKFQAVKLNDYADPETLKAESEEFKADSGEEANGSEEESPGQDSEIIVDQKNENGIQ